MLACKLAATGFKGVELSEVNLCLNEVADMPLDNSGRPSGIFTLYSLYGSYGRFEVADLVSSLFAVDGEEKTNWTQAQKGR